MNRPRKLLVSQSGKEGFVIAIFTDMLFRRRNDFTVKDT
jgi:hypothetical protein